MADDATKIVLDASHGDSESAERLLPLVYGELKQIAERLMRDERLDHSLQATALVHEAYLKLVDQDRVDWRGKTHFCAVASTAMRRILLDHARARAAVKRGGGGKFRIQDSLEPVDRRRDLDLVALDEAISELAKLNARHARVVELRFFGGLTVAETAHVLGVSAWTVKNDWRAARAWLMAQFRE